MPTNLGGVVDPADLVGREGELAALYRAIDNGGAKVLGDRRMGKTSALSAAADELRAVGHTVVQVSAETDDPATFSRHLHHEMRKERVLRAALPNWSAELGGEVGVNVGVAAFKLTGTGRTGGGAAEKDLFAACSEALDRSGPYRIIFIFDEITALARGLSSQGLDRSEEFFRTLRVPRQQLPNISIVLAGSIGLHHVLRDMAVVNDIRAVDVGPLSRVDAIYLARCLLRGADLTSRDEQRVANEIVHQCSAIPFYMHKLVQHLDETGQSDPNPAALSSLVTKILEDPADEWEMRHYETRIDPYYGHEAPLVRQIIDQFALHPAGLTMDQLRSALATSGEPDQPERDHLLTLLYRLEADHYLTRDGATDRVASGLLLRAWRLLRRLG